MEIICTQAEQSFTEVPLVVTVVTADEIRATGAGQQAEVLRPVPGIPVRRRE